MLVFACNGGQDEESARIKNFRIRTFGQRGDAVLLTRFTVSACLRSGMEEGDMT